MASMVVNSSIVSHQQMANAIRALTMDAVEKARSGHPGMPMGMADVATVLFRHFLKFSPTEPEWPDRDRFVLSAGHGSMLLYALLYLTGYVDMTLRQLERFRQLGSLTPGHPEHGSIPGVEATTGPLGQGLGQAVGMAIAERILASQFGPELVNHRTYVFASDGDLMEGISHEAISLAGHLQLAKLMVFFDDNQISIDGSTALVVSDDHLKRFEAAKWFTQAIDGHNPEAIQQAINNALASNSPSLIACRTVIAYGAPHKAGTAAAHGAPLGEVEVGLTKEALNWPYPAFEVPPAILHAWRQLGAQAEYAAWQQRLSQSPQQQEWQRRLLGQLPLELEGLLKIQIEQCRQAQANEATRISSQKVLDAIAKKTPELVGGSADLTPSTNTKAAGQKAINPPDLRGNYLHYGVREHVMGAVMNGLALHKGLIPYGGTFLIFSDYLKPALRLSALMRQRVIYVFTHDSIGLGEDGPTHQPIEQLASLRAIPHLNVLRPADSVEVAECWLLALQSKDNPSALLLTRQAVTPVRAQASQENLCAKGGYVLRESDRPREVSIFASGSEVGLAVEVSEQLATQGIAVAVISMPCWRLFDKQDASYRQQVIGDKKALRVAIEAAVGLGWERYIGEDGLMIGMADFGASAPCQELMQHFGFTAEVIVPKILRARKEK